MNERLRRELEDHFSLAEPMSGLLPQIELLGAELCSRPNVLRGLAAARRSGALTVAFTGPTPPAAGTADEVLAVPRDDTARIQEMHILAIRLLSEIVDEWALRQQGGQ